MGHVKTPVEKIIVRIKFTRNRFVAKRIRIAEEALQQCGVLLMIPIAENNGEFFIVLIGFVRGMQYKGGTQSVDVLTLVVL